MHGVEVEVEVVVVVVGMVHGVAGWRLALRVVQRAPSRRCHSCSSST